MAYVKRKIKNAIIGIAPEATRGTFVAPTTYYKVAELSLPDITADILDWETLRGTLTKEDYIIGNITASVSFDMAMPVAFSDITDANAWLGGMTPIFKAGGFEVHQGNVANTDVLGATEIATNVYIRPNDDSNSGLSVTISIDGHQEQIRGATANINYIYEAGQIAKINVTLEGIYVLADEVTQPTPGTLIGLKPQIVEDIYSFTLDGTNDFGGVPRGACLNALEVTSNVTSSKYPCAQSGKGVKFYEITDREVKSTCTVASSLGEDAQLDTDFRDGVATKVIMEGKELADGNNAIRVVVAGKITSKKGADVEGNRFHDIEVSGCGDKEQEFELMLEGLTVDSVAPVFIEDLQHVYLPAAGDTTAPGGVLNIVALGNGLDDGCIDFNGYTEFGSIRINGNLLNSSEYSNEGNGTYDFNYNLAVTETGDLDVVIAATDSSSNVAYKTISYNITSIV